MRKPHRKSRFGCANCKRRKVKCDEEKPRCSHCAKHRVRCSFEDDIAAATPTSDIAHASSSTAGGDLNVDDLELLHHYSTTTATSLACMDVLMLNFYRVELPHLGFKHHYVLHLIMAVSAIQLARFRADRAAYYLQLAHAHYENGLQQASAELAHINEDNGAALYIFALLCCNYALAKGPQPGEYLLFADDGRPEWLMFFRGMRHIFDTKMIADDTGPVATLLMRNDRRLNLEVRRPPNESLLQLRAYIVEHCAADPHCATYLCELDRLQDVLQVMAAEFYLRRRIFTWVYTGPDEFLDCLQQLQQPALAIFAHFCVLLNDLQPRWMFDGWTEHLLSRTYRALNAVYRSLIRWPIEESGWIPDC